MKIKTKRLVMTPRTIDSDIEKEVAWLNDPYVMKFSEQRHVKHTITSQIAYICKFGNRDLLFGIKREGALIGSASAIIDTNNRVADIGILIGDVFYWDQGFGKEAWIGLCQWLIQNRNIQKLEAGCMDKNQSMVNICISSGMQEEGRRRRHFIFDDEYCDLVQFGRLI